MLSKTRNSTIYMDIAKKYTWREKVQGDIMAWLKIWKGGWSPEDDIKVIDVFKFFLMHPGLRAAFLYRVSYELHKKRVKILPGMLARLNLTLHGFDVATVVDIGPGLYVPHPVGTVIMAESIGSNLTVISGTTIGMRGNPGFPRIGDNVFIGAGARVLGKIVIGDNVNIGANAVVLQSVPANCTAVGIPARIISAKSNKDDIS